MGRGRGKGKKLTAVSHEDAGSGEEEKIPAQKRRGRPQKPLKDDIDEEEIEKLEEDDSDNKGTNRHTSAVENGKKRRRNSQAKEKPSPAKQEEDSSTVIKEPSSGDLAKPNGFRQIKSRRKSTPHRAADVGVRVNIFLGLEPSPYPSS